jgi:hypothetical protein
MTMKVTGIQLREAIKRWNLRKDAAAAQFSESLWQFEDDKGCTSPVDLMNTFQAAESAIARLQVAQTRYNLAIRVTVQGDEMTLCEAVKRVGGAGRAQKMWRTTAVDKGRDRYSYREMTRKTDEVRAQRQVSVKDALTEASKTAVLAGQFRNVIAVGNTETVEIEDLEASLFE